MTTTVSLSFAALTIDSADPAALADFWGKALGRPVSPGAVAGDTAVDATGPDSGPRMILHHPPEVREGGGIGGVDSQGCETQADGGGHDCFLPMGVHHGRSCG